MQMQGGFDATQVKPNQGPGKHPTGVFDFAISNCEIVPTKANDAGMLVVTFTTAAGQIQNRYNLWNNNEKAVEIAHGQLSALCHATGIFRLNYQNEARELIGGRGKIQVGWQAGSEPTPEKPEGGYVEIKKVLTADGNEPGKAPVNQPMQPQQPAQQPMQQAPMQQQPNGGWGTPAQQPPQAQPPQQPAQPAWGAPQQPTNPQQPAGPAWGAGTPQQQPQQPQGGAAPPWANR